MTTPPTKPDADLAPPDDALPEDDALPGQSDEDWPDAAWIERNKDALNASIRKGDREFAQGKFSTLDEVMARIRARISDLKD